MRIVVPLIAITFLAVGCGDDDDGAGEPATGVEESITVTSSAFQNDQAIPKVYSCDGDNVSPPLAWHHLSADADRLALVVDDPDASGGTFVHWIVVDFPSTTTSVSEGGVPSGGVQAANSAGDATYTGPCPPDGTHHYRFTVYALNAPTGLDEGATTDDALAAIDEHALASGRLTGTYSRG
ncbi:MAG TPA: YbhB/YbcL family Raf kinase inhibitor-like protein [Nocardioidaceae bacterium]|nr:YbhB/YbcL family Raf kinase inhibitor-like protein [Nocardioidaceae bacterium]